MPRYARLTLIDSHPALGAALLEQFEANGEFKVRWLTSLPTPLTFDDLCESSAPPDAILLAADADGLPVSPDVIRDTGYRLPIVAMGPPGEGNFDVEKQTVAGANDALKRPLRYTALVARLRRLLRQHELSEEAVVVIGSFQFRAADKELVPNDQDGDSIPLTDKEALILKHLHAAAGRTISRESLLENVWGYHAEVSTHTLETHIYRLRQKIEPTANEPELLLTDAGGYRLVISETG